MQLLYFSFYIISITEFVFLIAKLDTIQTRLLQKKGNSAEKMTRENIMVKIARVHSFDILYSKKD